MTERNQLPDRRAVLRAAGAIGCGAVGLSGAVAAGWEDEHGWKRERTKDDENGKESDAKAEAEDEDDKREKDADGEAFDEKRKWWTEDETDDDGAAAAEDEDDEEDEGDEDDEETDDCPEDPDRVIETGNVRIAKGDDGRSIETSDTIVESCGDETTIRTGGE